MGTSPSSYIQVPPPPPERKLFSRARAASFAQLQWMGWYLSEPVLLLFAAGGGNHLISHAGASFQFLLIHIFVFNSTDWASSQQLQMWFSEHFSRQNLLCSLSRLLFLLRWNKYGAKKCLKNHIPFDFWDDWTLANQGAGKKNRKTFEGASTEPTVYIVIFIRPFHRLHVVHLQIFFIPF